LPYPAQTDLTTIVTTAQKLIEQEGVEQLSLARLAAALGIRAPSLYRHVASKSALIRAVNQLTLDELFATFAAATSTVLATPQAQMIAILVSYRTFALVHPQTYILAFTTTNPEERPETQALEQKVLPFQAIMAQITGEAQSLAALRGALALVHGFVMLELKGQLQREGDVGAAFAAAVQAYLQGWTK
jgi:AcrR family transcriptional regulator